MPQDLELYIKFIKCIKEPLLFIDSDGKILYSSDKFRLICNNLVERKNILDIPDFNLQCLEAESIYINLSGEKILLKNSEIKISNEYFYLLIADESYTKIKNLEGSLSEKEKFITILAHDLISPITGIIGFSELISNEINKTNINNSQKHLSQTGNDLIEPYLRISKRAALINSSTKEVYSLLENILEWSKKRKNNVNPFFEKVNLKVMIDECIEYIYNMASFKQLKIDNSVKKNIIIESDKNILKIIIRNFLSNAIKFTPRNGLIETSISDTINKGKKFISISVSDNGVGIADNRLMEILNGEILYSTKGTDSEKGTGIGLKLCRDYAQKLNGYLTIKSKRGKGTIASVHLPVKKRKND